MRFLCRHFIVFLVAFAVFCSAGCRHLSVKRDTVQRQKEQIQYPRSAYNVLMICLDTLRADHVGCYGYFRDTTPSIDALASKGILFERAFAQSSFTLPSLASVFTSRYVQGHRADRIERRLAAEETTLAEVLKRHGWSTAAFSHNAAQLDPRFGLDQGFGTYICNTERDRAPSFEKSMPAALSWITRHKKDKFFVFLHSNDIHEPYHCPLDDFFDPDYRGRLDAEYLGPENPDFHENNLTRTSREVAHIIAHYDAGIRYADGFIGRLMEALDALGLTGKTIIVLFSDHGEILADRGMRFCHGFSVHDEEIHVPLVIVHPGLNQRGARLKGLVQLTDIAPTLLELLGVSEGLRYQDGKSLVGMMEVKTDIFHRYVYAECFSGESEREGIEIQDTAVRGETWKLIRRVSEMRFRDADAPLPETVRMHNGAMITLPVEEGYSLYHLQEDPAENRNRVNQAPFEIEQDLLTQMALFDERG